MNVNINPIMVGEVEYFTIGQMASMTNKSEQTIYGLIKKGNSIRKMRSIRITNRVLIPIAELMEFPFTYAGPNAKENIYHYNLAGKVIE